MEYHMLYVESIKSLKDKKDKKYFFAECEKNTRQTCFFADCKKTLGKELVCRVPKKHSAKSLFVEYF